MTSQPRIIRKNQELDSLYHLLGQDDIIACRLRLKPQEEHLLLDLVGRGVTLIPSATSQLASRSKTFQARVFARWMLPHTMVVYDIHNILEAVSVYGQHGIEKVVVKHDRKNGGLGILLFQSIEEVFTQATNRVLSFPFVIQPFIRDSRDVRVIVIGDYIEAYERSNPATFRNNLHCGGTASPYELSQDQLALCHQAMDRGGFPYAHVDLMLPPSGQTYLAEINLRGGIRGAVVDPAGYRRLIQAREEELLNHHLEARAGQESSR